MIRISDIIRMGPQGEQDNGSNKEKTQDSLLNKALKRNTGEDTKTLYYNGVELLKDIFNKVRQTRQLSPSQAEEFIATSIDFRSVSDYLRKLIDRVLLGNEEFFDYFYSHIEDNYLSIHSLNVCLLAVKIGTWMDMNKSDLMNIALGALLHDIGLISVEEIISLPRQLKGKEIREVSKHSAVSATLLGKVKNITTEVIDTIKGHHKRLSDKDFAKELSNEKLQKISQIIGLADVYEAITHPRSYRQAKLPHEAIKELVEKESGNFQNRIIRSLIDNVGIYPIGSWVRLTNGEIGIITAINKGYPLRPRINIIFDSKSNRLPEAKSIDLLNEPHLHIESPVDIGNNKQLIDKLK